VDPVQDWTEAQARVIELVLGVPRADTERKVPACPDWTVRDLLAHMVGLDADVLSGDEPDDHNSTWTQRQVDARVGRDVGAIVGEWQAMTDAMRAWMTEHGARPLGDVIIHEQDLRSALGWPGAQDTEGLAILRDRMADGFAGRVADAGLAPAALVSPTWSFATSEGEPALTLRASSFDLTRALMSRRTAEQLRSWTTDGDIDPYLPLFSGLGPLPEAPLPE
jgi:uncharacterized protein (TIGR03083 family)